MPARLNAKGPGEFIRDHLLEPQTGGRDYVASIYQAYKDHLRSAGVRRLPCRPTFHKYVWLLRESGAIVFDGAQAISFSAEPPEDLPSDYEPALGSLRAVALQNGWPQRGVGFLILAGSELRAIWRLLPPNPSKDAGAMAQAMTALFALPEGSKGHPLGGSLWTALGERLGLAPTNRVPGMVLARLATRREAFVAPYVDALREALLLSEARGLEVKIDV